MLFGDEAVWGGDRSTESILKQLITEPSMIIEMKGKDVFEVRSFLRLMLATNSEWASPVSLTDHKYGQNGVMSELETFAPETPHEIGIAVESIADNSELATEVCALAVRNIFYARLPGVKGTAGAAALMSDEILVAEPG